MAQLLRVWSWIFWMEHSSGGFLMRIVPLQHTTITLPGTNKFAWKWMVSISVNDRFMGELLVSGNVKSWNTSIICRQLLLMRLIFIKPSTTFALMTAVGCPGGLRLRNGQLDRDELFGLCLALHQKLGVKLPDDVSVGLQLAFLGFEVFWDISKNEVFPPPVCVLMIFRKPIETRGRPPPFDDQQSWRWTYFGHRGIQPLPETNSKFAPENGWLEDGWKFP